MSDNTSAATAQTETLSQAPTFLPPADIYETENAVVMLLAPQGYTLIHAEYEDGNYERVFTLSELVDGDRIDAEFKDGVLRLTLPKTTPSPAKKINVRAA